MWGVWIDSRLCSHDEIIELGHNLLDNCFGVHIYTLIKSLGILNLYDIPWVQETVEPVVVFC